VPSARVAVPTKELGPGLRKIRDEFGVPSSFPPAVEDEAAAIVAGRGSPSFVDQAERLDQRDVQFLTIDPAGSRDLDQAFHAERRGSGYRVRYAIADAAAFVSPGGAVDRESWARGQTVYMPDGNSPLYSTGLSEGAASLLPESDRPAVLWTIDLDEASSVEASRLERTLVRSRRALSYAEVQSALDRNVADETLLLLREIGRLLEQREKDRDGVSLNLPDRELVPASGGYVLRYERVLPVEEWNAQISLLTGHCAAEIMISGGVGILRTLPPIDARQLTKLQLVARSLGIDWPKGASLGEVVRRQDGSTAESAAFLTQVAHALRDAGYTLVGDGDTPPGHGALRMTYAHVTAPLRRLADRYANDVVVSLSADRAAPEWAATALPQLPEIMAKADRRSDAVEAAVLNLAEAVILAPHVGRTFDATVVDRDDDRATIVLRDPPVTAKVPAESHELGETVHVRLVDSDPIERRITFQPG
jgi:exoribonuclease R